MSNEALNRNTVSTWLLAMVFFATQQTIIYTMLSISNRTCIWLAWYHKVRRAIGMGYGWRGLLGFRLFRGLGLPRTVGTTTRHTWHWRDGANTVPRLGVWRPDLSDRVLTVLSDVGLLARLLVLSDRELLVLPDRGLLTSAVVRGGCCLLAIVRGMWPPKTSTRLISRLLPECVRKCLSIVLCAWTRVGVEGLTQFVLFWVTAAYVHRAVGIFPG